MAVKALKEWKFAPYFYEGEPIRATFFAWVVFTSGDHEVNEEGTPQPANLEPIAPEFKLVLDKCSQYCRTLMTAGLYYVCTEKWTEVGREQEHPFSFKKGKEEKILGREAFVIEVRPRTPEAGDIIGAAIWFDKSTFQVLKAEVKTAFLAGFESYVRECTINHWKPLFTCEHYYEIEKDGILYPSRSVIRVDYDKMTYPKSDVKYIARIRYGQYRFFSVNTETEIKKMETPEVARCSMK